VTTVTGSSAADTYTYNLGDGDLTISEAIGGTAIDKIVFGEGIAYDDLDFSLVNHYSPDSTLFTTDLVISVKGDDNTITISNYYKNGFALYQAVELLTFSDGTTKRIDTPSIVSTSGEVDGTDGFDVIKTGSGDEVVYAGSGNDLIYGSLGNDIIYGGDGDDIINGSLGNDYIEGGKGNDLIVAADGTGSSGYTNIYKFNLGDGNDDLLESRDNNSSIVDTIEFGEGISSGDLEFSYVPAEGPASRGLYQDLIISIKGTTDSIRIWDFYYQGMSDSGYSRTVEQLKFADGTVLRIDNAIHGTASGDTINGTTGNDIIFGFQGNDVITGSTGNDYIYGGDGSDTIEVSWGDDHIYGGDGNDTIEDSWGDDHIYGGDGNDIIDDSWGNDYIDGGAGNDEIHGGYGNDTLIGGTGNDTYYFEGSFIGCEPDYGIKTIYETGTDAEDTIKVLGDLTLSDFTTSRDGDNLVFTLNETSKIVLDSYYNADHEGRVEYITFTDGTTVTLLDEYPLEPVYDNIIIGDDEDSTVQGTAGSDYVEGLGGRDVIYGKAGDDYLDGGDGNDHLQGDAGDDTLLGGEGNDTLIGGEGADTMDGGAGNDSLYVYSDDTFTGGEGSDTALIQETSGMSVNLGDTSIETVQGNIGEDYLDGSTSTVRVVEYGKAGNDTLIGGTAGDHLQGDAGDDTLLGGEGNDTLIGGEGADTMDGGAGNDSLYVYSDDTFTGGEGSDTALIQETSGMSINLGDTSIETVQGNIGEDYLDGSTSTVRVVEYGKAGDDTLIGGIAGDHLQGDAGDDTLLGGEGNDTLIGGEGADIMDGGAGNDSLYVYSDDTFTGGEGSDTALIQETSGMSINLGDASIETVQGNIGEDYLDGSTSTVRVVEYGKAGNDTLIGGTAGDHLQGDAGDDTLLGGEGGDTLIGGTDNDVLTGGAGNDTLYGQAGDDTYSFSIGDGKDTIINQDSDGYDALSFGEDITSDELWFKQSGNNLTVSVLGTSDNVTIQNWFNGDDANMIDAIELSNGDTLLKTQVDALVQAMSAFNPPSSASIADDEELNTALAPTIATSWTKAS